MATASTAVQRADEYECRILVTGCSGSGKSTLGNKLIDKADNIAPIAVGNTVQADQPDNGFTVSSGFDCATRKSQYQTGKGYLNGHTISIKVVDTPGLFDPVEKDIRKSLVELTRSLSLCCPEGPHAILFVVRYGRFTEQVEKAFDSVLKLFGDRVRDHLIVVFSHGEALGNTPIEIALANTKVSGLKKLLDVVGNNYLVSTNISDRRVTEKNALLDKIGKVSHNCTKPYTNNLLTALTQKIEEEIRSLIQQRGLSRNDAIHEVRRLIVERDERREGFSRIPKGIALSALSFLSGVGVIVLVNLLRGIRE